MIATPSLCATAPRKRRPVLRDMLISIFSSCGSFLSANANSLRGLSNSNPCAEKRKKTGALCNYGNRRRASEKEACSRRPPRSERRLQENSHRQLQHYSDNKWRVKVATMPLYRGHIATCPARVPYYRSDIIGDLCRAWRIWRSSARLATLSLTVALARSKPALIMHILQHVPRLQAGNRPASQRAAFSHWSRLLFVWVIDATTLGALGFNKFWAGPAGRF